MPDLPTTKTMNVGDPLIVQDWNTYVRDPIAYLLQPPACRVFNSATITHTNSGGTQYLTFNAEATDSANMHSTVTDTGRVTVTVPGIYIIGGCVSFAANANGARGVVIRLNGSTIIASDSRINLSALALDIKVTTLHKCNEGDYFELGAFQNSGGNLDLPRNADYSPVLWAAWVGGG